MPTFRVFATGGLKYIDISDDAESVIEFYKKHIAEGFLGETLDNGKPVELLIPGNQIGMITGPVAKRKVEESGARTGQRSHRRNRSAMVV